MDNKESAETRSEIIEILKNKNSFIITSHINPDGDAIGSQLALASILEEMGKQVTVINTDPVPDDLCFLPGSDKIVDHLPEVKQIDVAIVLDSGSLGRVGKRVSELVNEAGIVVNIDHHLSNSGFGNINLVEKEASSVGEQIFSVIEAIGLPVGKERAFLLYTAIFTDTGSFQYANTTDRTHEIVSCLFREGIVHNTLPEKLYGNVPLSRQKLMGLVLSNIKKLSPEGITWLCLTREMYEKSGAEENEADRFVNYARSVEGTKLAILFRETKKDDCIKVSLRSKGEVDVDSLARRFGGGGHKQAAGCVIKGSLEEVEKKVLDVAKEIIVTT